MSELEAWLAAYAATLDDDELERWCGAGLLARGRADYSAAVTIAVAGDRAVVCVGDNTVAIGRGGLPASTCTCPARSCRHRVVAALALRDRFAASATPVATPVATAAVALALDDDGARAALGARLWARAQAALARGVVVELCRDRGLTATFAGTGVSCAFPAALPLESSTCSCRKPFPCEHRAIALAAYLAAAPAPAAAPPPAAPPPPLPSATVAPILAFCHELVATGLDHAHAGWVRTAVRLAVHAHTARAPRLERELADLASQLELARARSARFELRATAIALARIAARARLLATRSPTQALTGSFQRSYLDTGPAELVCAGAQLFTTRDAANGVRLHFHDGRRFAVATVIVERDRPGSDPFRSPRMSVDRPLWGAGRWRDLLGTRLRLDSARRASDGTIATSAATRATVLERVDPWTVELGPRVTDWRTLVDAVAATDPLALGDLGPANMAVLAPTAIAGLAHDPVRDATVADLADAAGRVVRLELRQPPGNEAACRHAFALLAASWPLHVLGSVHRIGAGLGVAPIAVYARGKPIEVFGASTPSTPPSPAAPVARAPVIDEPFAATWRWLEDIVSAGLTTPGAARIPGPLGPVDTPDAILDAILATAVADELEGRAALARS